MAAEPSHSLTVVRGTVLRSALVLALRRHGGPMTVRELADALSLLGLRPPGRAGKSISDALRWECRRGRVRRVAESTYTLGHVARSTAWHMRERLKKHAATVQGSEDVSARAPGDEVRRCRYEAER